MAIEVSLHPGNAPVYAEATDLGECTSLKIWQGDERAIYANENVTIFIRRSQCSHEAVQAIAAAFRAAYVNAPKQEEVQ
jgi:nitrite reductase/ring-hydroxylating ferredoxin subunit